MKKRNNEIIVMKGCCCCFRKLPVEHFDQRWVLSFVPGEKTMLFFCVFRTVCCVGMFGGTENIGLGCSAFLSEHIQPRKSGSFLALRQLSDLQVRFFFFFHTDTESLRYSSSQSSRISLIWQFHPRRSNPKRGRKKTTRRLCFWGGGMFDVKVKAQQLRFFGFDLWNVFGFYQRCSYSMCDF